MDPSEPRIELMANVMYCQDVGANAVHTMVVEDYGNYWSKR